MINAHVCSCTVHLVSLAGQHGRDDSAMPGLHGQGDFVRLDHCHLLVQVEAGAHVAAKQLQRAHHVTPVYTTNHMNRINRINHINPLRLWTR